MQFSKKKNTTANIKELAKIVILPQIPKTYNKNTKILNKNTTINLPNLFNSKVCSVEWIKQ